MARKAHGNLAADASAHLARSANPVNGFSGNTQEINRQADCLIEWARAKNVILSDDYTSGMERHSGFTAEHEVFYREADNRVVKRTYYGTFGITDAPKGQQHHATPMFYLRRLELMNQVLGADLRLEGICFGESFLLGQQGKKPSIVISQPWIRAIDPQRPHPTIAEIEQFMESLDFTQLKGAFYGWYREADKITIVDAKPDNFIMSSDGVVPIDIVISQR